MPDWFFETGNPPYLNNEFPAAGSVDQPVDTLISVDIVDAESFVDLSTLDAYVNGADAYRIGLGFVSPYDGPASAITPTIVDGYDAYNLILDRTTNFPTNTDITTRIIVDDYGTNTLDGYWTFRIGEPPFIESYSPVPGAIDIFPNTSISFDIVDRGSGVQASTLDAYVNGADAYDGVSGFIFPYNGPSSSFSFVPGGSIEGYDAYQVVIDNLALYSEGSIVTTRVTGDDNYGGSMDESWSFTIITSPVTFPVNKLYFSDGYGFKGIEQSDLVAESQTQVSTLLSFPTIKSNEIQYIHGNYIDGYLWLALSYDGYNDGYGAEVVKSEVGVISYADGYSADKAQITGNGIMYLINQTHNRVEVYYGIHKQLGRDTPDFIYSTTSTPAIFPGQILCLKVIEGASLRYSGGSRLFIGTSQGMTRIEAYDQESPDGYGAGMDGYGLAIDYGIVGSGATNEVIGGTAPQVVAVTFNEELSIILVATNDGSNNGGITQIALSGNTQVVFLNTINGFLPTNDVIDISGGN